MFNFRMVSYLSIVITLIIFSVLFDIGEIYNFTTSLKSQIGSYSLLYFTLTYTLLLAIPFFPGIELGICIMCLFGKFGIIVVYFATIAGLSLSFLAGQFYGKKFNINNNKITKLFNSASFFIPRSMTLAMLLNAPGNTLFGGGGGISFSLGLDQNFKFQQFVTIVAIVTIPLPLMALLGVVSVENLI